MTDPTTPAAPSLSGAALNQAPVAPPPAVAPPAPPPAVEAAPAPPAAAQEPAERPRYVNPWKGRPAAVAAPAPPVVQPAAAPSPAASAAPSAQPAPVADPRVDALVAVLGETVAQDLAALPPSVAAAVRAIAPDSDPVAQRRAINAMRANGLAVTTPAPSTVAPPVTTMPSAQPAPAPAEPTGDAAILARYEALKAQGRHILAANFYASHAPSIERASRGASN
jgi:hypothetical protein